jgi:hypothetical protein
VPQQVAAEQRSSITMPDVAHLSHLTMFSTKASYKEGFQLPRQLQHLRLGTCSSGSTLVAAVMSLQQLTHLSFIVGFEEKEPLLQLAQLSALQHLALEYHSVSAAAATAAVWQCLPQLQELCLDYQVAGLTKRDAKLLDPPEKQQLAAVAMGVAVTPGLTKLVFSTMLQIGVVDGEATDTQRAWFEPLAPGVDGAHVFSAIASLTTLRDLHVQGFAFLEGAQASQLTTLSGLTRLVLNGQWHVAEDAAAAALVSSLPQLRHLELQNGGFGPKCVAATGHLQQLTELLLEGYFLPVGGFMQLTGLSQLQRLGWDLGWERAKGGPDEEPREPIEQFWAALKPLRRRSMLAYSGPATGGV